MGIIERKERNKQERKKLILNSAMKLFLDEGFQNVSIRRIAEAIEYSPATIYLYFKDKDEILYALHNAGFEELYKRQQEIGEVKNPKKRLVRHGQAYIEFAITNPEYYNLMFIMRSPVRKVTNGEEWLVGMRSYDLFKQDVKAAMDTGVLKKGDLNIATFSMWSMVHGVVALILRNRCTMMDPNCLPTLAQQSFEYLMKNMGITVQSNNHLSTTTTITRELLHHE